MNYDEQIPHEEDWSKAWADLAVLRAVHHPNIATYYCAFVTRQMRGVNYRKGLTYRWCCIVTDNPNGGNMAHEITRYEARSVYEVGARYYAWQVLSVLEYLHYNGIANLNLDPANVSLAFNGDGRTKRILLRDFSTVHLPIHTFELQAVQYPEPQFYLDDVQGLKALIDTMIRGKMNETIYALPHQLQLSREAHDLMNTIHYSIAQLREHPWFHGQVVAPYPASREEVSLLMQRYPHIPLPHYLHAPPPQDPPQPPAAPPAHGPSRSDSSRH